MYQNPYVKIKPRSRRPYTTIYLIRHCHPDYRLEKKLGEKEMPLSEAGLKQRRLLTRRLLTLGIDKIYSSAILRARESAELFATRRGREICVDSRLNEFDWQRWHRVKYFNMSEKTRRSRLKDNRELDRQLDRMQTEARRALADIYRGNKGKTIAIFSHGNFIKSLVTGILSADVIGFLSLEIFQSSISKLVIDRDGYIKIDYVNDADHLTKKPNEDLFKTLVD